MPHIKKTNLPVSQKKSSVCLATLLLSWLLYLSACAGKAELVPVGAIPSVKYRATRGADTAFAELKVSEIDFRGILVITYSGGITDSGDVKGIAKGDTLIGDYSFQHYGLQQWHRKPIAFLKKNNKLIMGTGQTKMTFGVMHFDPNVVIDYANNPLVFSRAE